MNLSTIKLTQRDFEILNFINRFGFCELKHLNQCFQLKKPRNYQILNRLMKAGLIQHKRLWYERPGCYRLTKAGAAHTMLAPLLQLPLSTYQHALCVIEVYLGLRVRYPEAKFISERELIQQKIFASKQKTEHLPDGLLVFPDGKQVALEIELTLKARQRLENILKSYATQFDTVHEVWYFCTDAVYKVVQTFVSRMPYLKTYRIQEFLI